MKRTLLSLVGAVCLAACAAQAQTTNIWLPSTGTSDFNTGANWDIFLAPTIADAAWFTNSGASYSVTVATTDASANGVVFNGANSTIDLNIAAGLTFTNVDFRVASYFAANPGPTTVVVGGPGTLSVGGSLGITLGNGGNGGTLLITNGTTRVAGRVVLGDAAGVVSSMTVSGPGTVLTNLTATVVQVGRVANANGNSFTVANGASVFTGGQIDYAGANAAASNNVVAVTSGATWNLGAARLNAAATSGSMTVDGATVTNVGEIIIGNGSGASGNLLTLTNGAQLFTGAAGSIYEIGRNGSKGNTMLLTGGSTYWNHNLKDFRLGSPAGAGSSSNTLIIADGAVATNISRIFISDNNASTNNQLVLRNGGQLHVVGGSGDVTVGTAGNSVGHLFQVGGEGAASSAFVGKVTVGNSAGTSGNRAIVTNGTLTLNVGDLVVGNNTTCSNNLLLVQAGGVVDAPFRRLATGAGLNNGIIIDGGVVTNFTSMVIGNATTASGGYLIVTNGGKLTVSAVGFYELGRNTGSTSNRIVVAGAGSEWVNNNPFAVKFTIGGTSGITSNNAVEIRDGGLWDLGYTRLDMNNYQSSLTIAGGIVTNASEVIVGNNGYGHTALISSGGKLYSGATGTLWDVGRGANANDSTMTITGAGSTWDAGGQTVTIGNDAFTPGNTNNALALLAGGVLTNASLTINTGGGLSNRLVLNGGAAWLNNLTLSANGLISFAGINSTTTPIIDATGTVSGAGTIVIADTTGMTAGNVYPLIKYGTDASSFAFSAPAACVLTNDTANSIIGVLLTGDSMSTTPTNLTSVVSGNQLTLSWPSSHQGWELQSNAVSLVSPAAWATVPGSTSLTNFTHTIDYTKTSVFFRLHLP